MVYMSSIRHVFKLANLDVDFLASEWVSSARTAVTLLYRQTNPIAGRVGLPFTCDMIVYAMLKAFNTGSAKDQAIVTAMKLAATCLMRVSEYLPGSPCDVEHLLRSQDVAFGMKDSSVVPS